MIMHVKCYRYLIPAEVLETGLLLDYETYERWTTTFRLSVDDIKKITAVKFYYYLAQELGRIIAMMIKINCDCLTDVDWCESCSLLSQTGVNHAQLCLRRYLKDAISWIEIKKIVSKLHNSNKKVIDFEEVDGLSSSSWRTRSELDLLHDLTTPFFGLRKIDKRQCMANLVTRLCEICQRDGASKRGDSKTLRRDSSTTC